jgi:hypothetical protein
LEEHVTSIFRVKEYAKQENIVKKAVSRPLLAGSLNKSVLKWNYEKDKGRERKRVKDKIWRK